MSSSWLPLLFLACSASGCCSLYATSGCLSSEEIRSTADQQEVLEWLGDERSWVREEAARTLGRARSPLARERLESMLQDRAEKSYVRAACAEALGSIADPQSLPLLSGVVAQPDLPPEVKIASVRALCAFEGPEPLAAIAPLASNEDLLVSAAASAQLASSCGRAR